MDFVDNLMEDEIEIETLLAKPTCFIIVGKPGIGKSTLAKNIADSWKCILIDDTDVLNTHIQNRTKEGLELLDILSEGGILPQDKVLQLILNRLDSPDVEHYGYVLSCLPFMSEECMTIPEQVALIKNLKLTPDFIINIKCADKDLAQRLSGLKQYSETGQLFTRDQWQREDVYIKKKDSMDEAMENEKEQAAGKGLQRDVIYQMVWLPENLTRNALIRINMYKDTVLKPLEDYMAAHNPLYRMELDGNNTPEELHSYVMSRLGSLGIKRVSIPILLHQADEDLPEEADTGDLLRHMSSSKPVAPGFRWRRSRWGQTCPVALKEGRVVPGQPELSVSFQDKLYILSSAEAYQNFVTNPRRYLLPPMPRPPCKVSIVGPPQSGKSTLCKLLAQHYNALVLDKEDLGQPILAKIEQETHTGWVLDNFPSNLSQLNFLNQGEILPHIIFCLNDSGGHKVLERMYKKNKESVDKAVRKRLRGESNLETIVEENDAVTLPDHWELGYPDCPEMKDYKLQLRQFVSEWEEMETALTTAILVLEVDGKSPEDLLQEIVLHMEKPFKYVPWELSQLDLFEEEEDTEALAELERPDENSSDNKAPDDEDKGDTTPKRLLGDTLHFCPVAFKNQNILWPCMDEIAAKYREKIFYFSNTEARDTFLQNPIRFVAKTEPLKPPALRILSLGTRGSGKTSHGEWLARQLGLFHVRFREQLQMLLIAKTKIRVPYADEVEPFDESLEDLVNLIEEAREEAGEEEEEKEVEDTTDDEIEEVKLTDEEDAIKAYLSDGDSLSPQILERVIAPFWDQEPYISTGFILEGFPHHSEEVQYMLDGQLFPDVVVTMEVNVTDVQKRLLPTYLEKWRKRRDHRVAQMNILQDLRKKIRDEKMVWRRAELTAELLTARFKEDDEEDEEVDEKEEAADSLADEIEAILEVEFPLEDSGDSENEENEEAAIERLEMEIKQRFAIDEEDLATVMELLSEQNIPSISISASRKPRFVRNQLLQKLQPLLANRQSLFQTCQSISFTLAQRLLLFSYKLHSAFGCLDPIKQYKERDLIQPLQWPLNTTHPVIFNQYIYFFESEENRNTFMLNPLKYLRQPKPTPSLPVKLAVVGPPKSGKTTVAQSFAQKYGLARLSIGRTMRMVLETQEHTDLAVQLKQLLSQGLVVPDELAIQCLEVVLLSSVCSTRGYVLDGFPMTLKQAELMASRSIIPMIVIELEMDTVEVLRRGHVDQIKPNKPHLMHDSSELLHIRTSHYKQHVEQVKKYFQYQYRNWNVLDGFKSKWWIWSKIVKEVSISMAYIDNFLERTLSGQAASIDRMCITPEELQNRLEEFGHYCPDCLAINYHLVDCSETVTLTHAAEYRGKLYKMCGKEHLEKFLSTPEKFVTPRCPYPLPEPHMLPSKLTEIQVKSKFPQQVEMMGFCPVTYLCGKQRYEALVQGKMEYAVEYRERFYFFRSNQEQNMFLRSPETYWNQRLPVKVPPLCDPVPLTALPTLGYLEQAVAVAVIKAMTAAGCLKPKYPFVSTQRSAILYVAFYLKATNEKSDEYIRRLHKDTLTVFEKSCALLPYLSSTMRGRYKQPSERPIDFDSKMNEFLALKD
ncbi:adenylate kinase 9-like [Hippoglossus hippoglossus]|uniref:adenylate kinase 9-like n=1 Tax=Hippoglossus hippoglossus TaxID=8267 RepID=UPI00148BBC3B|nr:adenylate kinase 9-like [Hippoglossus hippoglossus]